MSGRRLLRLGRTIGAISVLILTVTLAVQTRDGRPSAAPELRRLADPTARPTIAPATATPTPRSASGTGKLVIASGSSSVSGPGAVRTFVVEVESGIGTDPATFAAAVQSVLFDARSWSGTGRIAFQRVDSRGSFRVTLASPQLTRQLCGPFDTGRSLSCYNGGRAVINAYSWTNGKPFFPDLATYRAYQINHEVGHALGQPHRRCAGAGRPAPVMQQQSKGLDGCTANAWPLESERG